MCSNTYPGIRANKYIEKYRPSSKDTCENTLSKNLLCSSDGSNNVQSSMFDRSKPKIGSSSSITNRLTRFSSFDVRKKDVWASLMSNLVNLVKTLLDSKFVIWLFEAKNKVLGFDHK